MITTLILGVLALRPQTVTFEHPCASASVVLEALGKAVGERMAPGGSVLRDYFAVRFTDRSVADVERVLAEALNAKWVRRGDYLVLDRGPAEEAKEEALAKDAIRRGVEDFVKANPVKAFSLSAIRDKMLDAKRTKPDSDAEWGAPKELQALMPAARFGTRFVYAVGAETLANVTEDKPLRFYLRADGSTNMPAKLKQVVQEYSSECDAVYELAMNLEAGIFLSGYGPPAGRPIGYMVTVRRSPFSLLVLVQRELMEMPGGGYTQPGHRFEMMMHFAPRVGENPAFPAPRGKLTLGPDAMAMLKLGHQRFGFQEFQPTEEETVLAMGLARDLEKNDPLTMFGSAPLMEAGRQAGKDFVALMSDGEGFQGLPGIGEDLDLSKYWSSWYPREYASADEKTGIIKILPTVTQRNRDLRIDREAASRYVKACQRDGYANLWTMADLAVSCRTETAWWNTTFNLEPFSGLLVITADSSLAALKLLGRLSDAQRAQAKDGGVVLAWEALTGEVQEELARVMFSEQTAFAQEVKDAVSWMPYVSWAGKGSKVGAMAFEREVPRGTTVRVRVNATSLLKPGPGSSGVRSGYPHTVKMFANSVGRDPSDNPDYSRAAVVPVERADVDVFVPGFGYTRLFAQSDGEGKNTKYVPLDQLPEPFRTQLAEEIKKRGGG